MKKFIKITILLLSISLFTSCSFHRGYMGSSTSLSQPNFSYIQKNVEGNALATYILAIGGVAKDGLVKQAKEEMMKNYPVGDNEAYVNITVNFKTSYYIVWNTVKCTVSADIVRFI